VAGTEVSVAREAFFVRVGRMTAVRVGVAVAGAESTGARLEVEVTQKLKRIWGRLGRAHVGVAWGPPFPEAVTTVSPRRVQGTPYRAWEM
jgi:hypothetical protein